MSLLRSAPLALLLIHATALADVPSAKRVSAHDHLRRGSTALAAGNCDAAIREFQAGFLSEPDPQFTRLIGDAYAASARPEQALASYRMYLRQAPAAADRVEAEARMAGLLGEARAAAESAEREQRRDDALALWQRYLDLASSGRDEGAGQDKEVGAARARIEALRASLAISPSPPAGSPAPAPAPRLRRLALGLGIGGGLLILGATALALALTLGGGPAPVDAPLPTTTLGNLAIHF